MKVQLRHCKDEVQTHILMINKLDNFNSKHLVTPTYIQHIYLHTFFLGGGGSYVSLRPPPQPTSKWGSCTFSPPPAPTHMFGPLLGTSSGAKPSKYMQNWADYTIMADQSILGIGKGNIGLCCCFFFSLVQILSEISRLKQFIFFSKQLFFDWI